MNRPRNVPPPIFPLGKPARQGWFRRTPPAIFPAVLGLLGLGLAWRAAAAEFALPPGIAEAFLGAATVLWMFALLAYAGKLWRRSAVAADDLHILPGREGLAALAMTLPAVALVVLPYAPRLAAGLTLTGLAVHLAVIATFVQVMRAGPIEGRSITPAWQPMFAGPALAALPALSLGWTGFAGVLCLAGLIAAALLWLEGGRHLLHRIPPAPLRPLLALHLGPAAVAGLAAQGLGFFTAAQGFALLAGMILLALIVAGRWLAAAGPTAFWGAFCFPIAATADLFLSLGGIWRKPGALVLVAATLLILPVALNILRGWAKGSLAARTGAAEA